MGNLFKLSTVRVIGQSDSIFIRNLTGENSKVIQGSENLSYRVVEICLLYISMHILHAIIPY